MPATYEIGQEVIIRPVIDKGFSIRETSIEPFVGKTGRVSDLHWITPPAGTIFYLYTIKVDGSNKELILYEDEIGIASKAASHPRKR